MAIGSRPALIIACTFKKRKTVARALNVTNRGRKEIGASSSISIFPSHEGVKSCQGKPGGAQFVVFGVTEPSRVAAAVHVGSRERHAEKASGKHHCEYRKHQKLHYSVRKHAFAEIGEVISLYEKNNVLQHPSDHFSGTQLHILLFHH